MSIEAGQLDAEHQGINSQVAYSYSYTGSDLTSITASYNDGIAIQIWTKTFTYNAGILTAESAWVKS